MSFSGMVKEELSRQINTARHCRIAELAAILCVCGSLEYQKDGNKILRIHTENELVARKYFTLLKKTFNIETAVFLHENAPLKEDAYMWWKLQISSRWKK